MAKARGASTIEAGDSAQGLLDIDIPDAMYGLQITQIPHSMIEPDPTQPRTEADEDLRASIAQGGIRQAITVRAKPDAIGLYIIVDGERRWRSAAGVQDLIPCVVRTDLETRSTRLRDQLVMNKGKELSPVEQAIAFAELHAERGGSIAELAVFVGEPVSTVSQRLNLMQLGPWLEFLKSGRVRYSHAVEKLFVYRSCPDAVHGTAIAALAKRLEHPIEPDGSAFSSAHEFGQAVNGAYSKLLYPISKQKYDERPIFDVRSHDSECPCGGITLEDFHGDKRKHCGNPEWWQPRQKAAHKAAKQREAKKAEKETETAAAAKKPFYAPADADRLGGYAHDVPEGWAPLVGYDGKWSCDLNNPRGEPFDPADLGDVGELEIGLQGKAPYEQLLVKLGPKVEAARAKWAARAAAAEEKIVARWRKSIEKKVTVTVRRDSAREILAVMLSLLSSFDDAEEQQAMEAAAKYAGATLPEWGYATATEMLEAIADVSDAQAADVLAAFTCIRTKELALPGEELEALRLERAKEIQKVKTPWAKKPKGGAAAVTAKPAAADDDELEEVLDDDSHEDE
jgi:ParB/RepB/Spo0J family partition protein